MWLWECAWWSRGQGQPVPGRAWVGAAAAQVWLESITGGLPSGLAGLDLQHGMALERSMASPLGRQPCLSMDLWNWEDWGSKGGGHTPMSRAMVCLVKGLLVPRAAWKGS